MAELMQRNAGRSPGYWALTDRRWPALLLLAGLSAYVLSTFVAEDVRQVRNIFDAFVVLPVMLVLIRNPGLAMSVLRFRIFILFLALIALFLLPVFWSPVEDFGELIEGRLRHSLRVIFFISAFLIIPDVRRHFSSTIPVVFALGLLAALAQYIPNIIEDPSARRVVGGGLLAENPNITAFALSLGALFCWYLFMEERDSKFLKASFFILFAVTLISSYWTMGRASILALMMAISLYTAMSIFPSSSQRIVWATFSGLLFFVLVLYSLVHFIDLSLLSGRDVIWRGFLDLSFCQFLFGVGFAEGNRIELESFSRSFPAHSAYIDIIYRAGLLGLVTFLGFIIILLRLLVGDSSPVVRLYIAVLLYFLVFNVFEGTFPVRNPVPRFFLLWLPLGVLMSLIWHGRRV